MSRGAPRGPAVRGGRGQVAQPVGVLGEQGFLDEQRVVRGEVRQQLGGVGDGEPAVEVDGEVPVVAEGFAGGGGAGDDLVDVAHGRQPVHPAARVHLHGGEAGLHLFPDGLGDLGRFVAADPAVGPYPVAHGAAQQLVHGGAVHLAGDVPQGLVESGDRAGEHGAAAVERPLGHGLPVVLDTQRVLPDEEFGQLSHGGADGGRTALDHRLAPADDAVVRLDTAQQPARWHGEGLDAGDLHASPWCGRARVPAADGRVLRTRSCTHSSRRPRPARRRSRRRRRRSAGRRWRRPPPRVGRAGRPRSVPRWHVGPPRRCRPRRG